MSVKFPLCLLLFTALALAPHVPGQKHKKPTRKDFGQSLKKLKWDPEQNTGTATSGSQSSETDDGDVVRIETTLVSCSVLVMDNAGRIVQGLKQTDFEISENDTPQQVGHFVLGDNANLPRSIVLIIDYSGSQFPFIKNSIEAAKVLVDKLGRADQMAIVTDDVEMLV